MANLGGLIELVGVLVCISVKRTARNKSSREAYRETFRAALREAFCEAFPETIQSAPGLRRRSPGAHYGILTKEDQKVNH